MIDSDKAAKQYVGMHAPRPEVESLARWLDARIAEALDDAYVRNSYEGLFVCLVADEYRARAEGRT